LSRGTIAERLRAAYPSCMLYSIDGFVGASPELLVARAGDVVRCHPMAGTAPRSDDPSTDARLAASLISSTKDQREHRVTIDMVHDTLLPWCSYLDEEAEPSIVAMANVQHLATLVEGRLSTPPASIIELMTALHPTPAVGGSPRSVALDLIDRFEHLDRGRYGGPVGWVDAAGNGAWAVGIRSAEIDGATARLFAGVGVLPRSDVDAELAETRAKLQALLGAIVRP
jgi:isochorismate synthase